MGIPRISPGKGRREVACTVVGFIQDLSGITDPLTPSSGRALEEFKHRNVKIIENSVSQANMY